jgi:hypothetical protein
MSYINRTIVALYLHNKETMKFSSPRAILIIAKLTICLLLFAWLAFFTLSFERFVTETNYFSYLPKGKYALAPLVFIMYLLLERVTWGKDKVLQYIEETDGVRNDKALVISFFLLVLTGIGLAALIGYQNKWHPLP